MKTTYEKSDVNIRCLAEDCYNTYTVNSDNKNFQGNECPTWSQLPPLVRDHWCAVAAAFVPGHGYRTSMHRMIGRLFREAPKMTDASGKVDESQAPALECHVVLRGSIPPIQGVLSTTPEGALRLMTLQKHQGKSVMIEQFFDYSDVISIAVVRDVAGTSEGSLIHRA